MFYIVLQYYIINVLLTLLQIITVISLIMGLCFTIEY